MDTASRQYGTNIKFFSIFSGGLEEMELRRSNGLPAFVLHGENFPKNIAQVMTEFEKTLRNYDLENGQDVLYQLIEKTQLSSNATISLPPFYVHNRSTSSTKSQKVHH